MRRNVASPSRCGSWTTLDEPTAGPLQAGNGTHAPRAESRAGPPARGSSRRLRPVGRESVGRRPGLLLDDEVALDGKHAASVGEVKQLDQLGVDVELRAVLAEAAGNAEAEPLTSVGEPECRVEPGGDETPATGGTAISNGGHAGMLGVTPYRWHDPQVPPTGRRLATQRFRDESRGPLLDADD